MGEPPADRVPPAVPPPTPVDGEVLRQQLEEQRRRADDALSRIATAERSAHAARERANAAEAARELAERARVAAEAERTSAQRQGAIDLDAAKRGRDEAEPRLNEMLALPDELQ